MTGATMSNRISNRLKTVKAPRVRVSRPSKEQLQRIHLVRTYQARYLSDCMQRFSKCATIDELSAEKSYIYNRVTELKEEVSNNKQIDKFADHIERGCLAVQSDAERYYQTREKVLAK